MIVEVIPWMLQHRLGLQFYRGVELRFNDAVDCDWLLIFNVFLP